MRTEVQCVLDWFRYKTCYITGKQEHLNHERKRRYFKVVSRYSILDTYFEFDLIILKLNTFLKQLPTARFNKGNINYFISSLFVQEDATGPDIYEPRSAVIKD